MPTMHRSAAVLFMFLLASCERRECGLVACYDHAEVAYAMPLAKPYRLTVTIGGTDGPFSLDCPAPLQETRAIRSCDLRGFTVTVHDIFRAAGVNVIVDDGETTRAGSGTFVTNLTGECGCFRPSAKIELR